MKSLKAMMLVVAMMVAGAAMAQPVPLADSDPEFTVEATVVEVCRVTTEDLSFGEYNVLMGEKEVTGTITVQCTKRSTGSELRLSLGTETGATRQMTSAGAPTGLNYKLTYEATKNVGTGEPVDIAVTALILENQWDVEAGTYSEIVTASIVF